VDTNNEPEREKNKPGDTLWHPAFCNAIRLELDEYEKDLSFVFEHPLTTGPLKIDVMIIKKARGARIDKNIAEIFRAVNLVEYKSPGDYVSVDDFLKVHGYAYLYASMEKGVDITDMTLTFVESRKPRNLLKYLREKRGFAVEKKRPGFYSVDGDFLPIQIIDSRELSADENLWLKGLSDTLGPGDWLKMLAGAARFDGKHGPLAAYLDVLMRANGKSLMEAYEMSGDMMTLDSIFEGIGLAARWKAEGISIGEARGISIGEARGISIGEARGISIGDARGENRVLGLFKQGYTVEEVERMLAGRENAEAPPGDQR